MVGRLGIIDFRNIIASLKEFYSIDLSDFALTSLKRRLEKVIKINNLGNADGLINRIKSDKDFVHIFLRDISVEETEMFRDPHLWIYLRDELIPKIAKDLTAKIWMPTMTTGEDLYTLLIILKEIGLYDKIDVITSSISKRNIQHVQDGVYEMKRMEVNTANYERFEGTANLSDYFEIIDNKAHMDKSLLNRVQFQNIDIVKGDRPSRLRMVIYRNKMIYYNLQLQNRVLKTIYESLSPNAYFVIGIKESIANSNADKRFAIVNKTENVYRKVL